MTSTAEARLRYPAAPKQDVIDVLHGVPVPDPYRWLEDASLPETVRWQAEQEELYRRMRLDWQSRAEFAEQLGELLSAGYRSPPECYGDRRFWLSLPAGQEHVSLISEAEGVERVCFDPIAWDPSGRTLLEAWQPSWQGDLVVLQVSTGGTEDCQLLVLDVRTGEIVDGPIDRVRKSSIGWLPEGGGFYYVRRLPPEEHSGDGKYHRRVYLHRLGRPTEQDALIFGEGRDGTVFYAVEVLPAAALLVLTASLGARSAAVRDVWVARIDAHPDRPALEPLQLQRQARTRIRGAGTTTGLLYLQTDLDAPRGRVVTVPIADPFAEWLEFLPEDPTAVLIDFVLLQGPALAEPLVVVNRRRHGISELELVSLASGERRGCLPLPGAGVVSQLTVAGSGDAVWFSYTNPAQPSTVLNFDARTGRLSGWPDDTRGQQPVCVQTVSYESRDGTPIRMFIVSAAGQPDRPRPTILSGYGGFGASQTPVFRAEAAAWVAAGGVFAIACLRGGGEEGAQWHRAGTVLNKQNVFDDFDAATDYLIERGWTRPDQLGIYGGSNGGLLVGVALTKHPEKYAAAVCMAPLLDMVRYEASGLGPSWRPEYGTAADPVEFANLLGYSPYHAVRAGVSYPAVLFAVFDGDTRVDLLHARKMCAALQSATGSGRPIVLRTERGVGHGARTVSSGAALLADFLSFLTAHLGS